MILLPNSKKTILSILTGATVLFMSNKEIAATNLRGDSNSSNSSLPADKTKFSTTYKPTHDDATARDLQNIPIGCDPQYPGWIGDGWCDQDSSYNSAACGYDGGDCCADTCDSTQEYDCTMPFDCKDPSTVPFTIIFISDLENKYRGHSVGRSEYVVSYIKDLAAQNIYFNPPYAGKKVDPKLVIHGGDISHMWSCENTFGCRSVDDEFNDIWGQLYDSGIPMISAFGNHDWAQVTGVNQELWGENGGAKTDNDIKDINQMSSTFVHKSYEKASAASNGEFTYTEFPPTGEIGQSMYKANFRGLQIGHLGCASSWESYDSSNMFSPRIQLRELGDSLDRNAKTLFFSHYPVHKLKDTADENTLKELIWEFPGAQHFSGHDHTAQEITYTNPSAASQKFTDYIAPYPHSNGGAKPGVYAILASATGGVLDVKPIDIDGWEDGSLCGLGTTCKYCNAGNMEYWESKAMTACGKEPCWENGSICGPGTTCTSCCNGSEYWESKASMACGPEPCWENGSICGLGTCTSCCNGSEYWESKAFMACGPEPCWGGGTICGAGTTCNSCCGSADCPWYQFGICTCN